MSSVFQPGDKVWLRPAKPGASCDVHDWPADGLARRLIEAMRERHGNGGLNVCVDCLARAKQDAKERAGL